MTHDFEIAVKYAGYKQALAKIGGEELPEAIAAGINRIASSAHLAQRNNLRGRFILRNKYTERSLAYYKANPKKDINRINAIIGSKQAYLALQEEGGTRRPVRGSKVPVPTMAARGGNWRAPIPRRYALRKGALAAGVFILRPGTTSWAKWSKRRRAHARLTRAGIFKREKSRLLKIRFLDRPSYKLRARRWHRDAVEKYGKSNLMAAAFMAEAKRRLAKYQAV
jgi:hypothetical protein